MIVRAASAALVLAFALGACTTAPKPCTTEWVEYRTDQILHRFARENRALLSDLRQLKKQDGELDTVRVILLAAQADDIRRFANSFNTIIIPELKDSVGQCRNDENFVPAFTEFLRREGVSEEALAWVGPVLALSQVIDTNQ